MVPEKAVKGANGAAVCLFVLLYVRGEQNECKQKSAMCGVWVCVCVCECESVYSSVAVFVLLVTSFFAFT